ncbi:uncharacterized protein A4U43_C06F12290 [Asparagus officinalis]|uniref:Uncharacterized protein n=1 Tax=Asparagus officinalis TaxID=4686 RepID=A0A5P1ENU2_ASPOF|nr:uncharacterized protein A4U43_C06F12290 [Asparagus officinalis]
MMIKYLECSSNCSRRIFAAEFYIFGFADGFGALKEQLEVEHQLFSADQALFDRVAYHSEDLLKVFGPHNFGFLLRGVLCNFCVETAVLFQDSEGGKERGVFKGGVKHHSCRSLV